MTVLVAYASAHASTVGIAQQIADRLLKSGLSAVARPVDEIDHLRRYQAVVLGSAVQNQQWLPEVAAFLRKFAGPLVKRPAWLFSSSSVGATSSFFGPRVTELVHRERSESDALSSDTVQFRDYRHFTGDFERGGWSPLGDLFLKICGGSAGDHCDWRDVNDWTAGIARELQGIDHAKERRRLHLSVRGKP